MNEQDRIRNALAKLADVLGGIARTADEKNRGRCPYKTVDLRCTYSGGCQNQVRDASRFALGTSHFCAGDHLIDRSPAPEYEPRHIRRTTDPE